MIFLQETESVDFSFNQEHEEGFRFFDNTLVDAVQNRKNEDVALFFKVLALCHTVMPAERDGKITPFPIIIQTYLFFSDKVRSGRYLLNN